MYINNHWDCLKDWFEFILFKIIICSDKDWFYMEITIFNFEFIWEKEKDNESKTEESNKVV